MLIPLKDLIIDSFGLILEEQGAHQHQHHQAIARVTRPAQQLRESVHRPSSLQLAPVALSCRIMGVQRQHNDGLGQGHTVHFWQEAVIPGLWYFSVQDHLALSPYC